MNPNQPLSYTPPATPYPTPSAPINVPNKAFTPIELMLIQDIMAITPKSFLEGCNPGFDQKIRLLGIAALALQDINNMPPETRFTFNNLPDYQRQLLLFGTQLYLMLFEQARYSLIDISYNDNGLGITFDRVGKLGQAYDKMKEQYEKMLKNFKMNLLVQSGGVGLGTPRYQSNLSRFISTLGNGAYGWQIP